MYSIKNLNIFKNENSQITLTVSTGDVNKTKAMFQELVKDYKGDNGIYSIDTYLSAQLNENNHIAITQTTETPRSKLRLVPIILLTKGMISEEKKDSFLRIINDNSFVQTQEKKVNEEVKNFLEGLGNVRKTINEEYKEIKIQNKKELNKQKNNI